MKRLIKTALLALAALVACVAFGWQVTVIADRAASRAEAAKAGAETTVLIQD